MRLESRSWLGTRNSYCARWFFFFFFFATSHRICHHTLSYIACSPEVRASGVVAGTLHLLIAPQSWFFPRFLSSWSQGGGFMHRLKPYNIWLKILAPGSVCFLCTVTNCHKFCGLKQQKCIIPQLWRSEGKIHLSGQNKHVGSAAFFTVSRGEPASSPFTASRDFLPVV